ncbi:MAG: ATP-binding protein [Candidatus Omnitrophica bacterium]|nr:ATP-binding protein [Candidatus Omnitrophota bacterium]
MAQQDIKESISITSDIKEIRKVSSRIVGLLMERMVDKALIFDIRLAVEEAIINAIEHGNKRNKRLKVKVSFGIDNERMEITVEDSGSGFDHKGIPDPTEDKNVLRSHGRGIYLIHRLMDRIEYNDKGNRIKLTKYIKKQ